MDLKFLESIFDVDINNFAKFSMSRSYISRKHATSAFPNFAEPIIYSPDKLCKTNFVDLDSS